MADKITYVTSEGLEKLKAELHELKTVTRRELALRLEAAKALGDLSENAEYHEAKDSLGMTEGRIREIDDMLKNIAVIDQGATKGGVVRVGSTVEVEVNGKTKSYTIVGSNEADPMTGRISNESPLGNAFLDRALGDTVSVETPNGTVRYNLIKIS